MEDEMGDSEMKSENVAAVQYLWYGHKNVPKKSDFEFSWKAIKTIAALDGRLSEPERLCLLGKMCAILTPPDVVDLVMQFDEQSETPEQLLARIDVPQEVRAGTGAWIIYEGLSVSIADGELADEELAGLCGVAATMGVPTSTVYALHDLCKEEAALRRRRIEMLHSTISTTFRFDNETEEQAQGRVALSGDF
jgi:hypothetical protein